MDTTTSIIYETTRWQAAYADGELIQLPNMYRSPDYPTSWKLHYNHSNKQNSQKFKPTWLVRVDDMVTVPGSSVSESYNALSYSWNQAGDISKKDKMDNKKIMEITHLWRTDSSPSPQQEVSLSFKNLIQRICKEFGIQYIWFDQLCINQQDGPEKQEELKNLHCIYGNAKYTVVLIPELSYDQLEKKDAKVKVTDLGVIATSEWSKRVWTLEESYMSRQMLFVGRNIHLWSNITSDPSTASTLAGPFLYVISDKSVKWTASTALFHIRTRQSTKKIDRYRALANMFPEMFSNASTKIIFGGDQRLEDVAIHFYGVLAKTDLTILKFGLPYNFNDDGAMMPSGYEENELTLPTWTGIKGRHVPQDFEADRRRNDNTVAAANRNNKDDRSKKSTYPVISVSTNERFLSIICDSIKVSLKDACHIKRISDHKDHPLTNDGLPYSPIWMEYPRDLLFLEKTDSLPHSITCTSTTTTQQEKINSLDIMTPYRIKATHILPVKMNGKLWINTLSSPTHTGAYLSLTEGNCTECIILSGIQFEMSPDPGITGSPVITKCDNRRYKAIGLCIIDHSIFTYCDSLQHIEAHKHFVIE
ncbi:hypothetical protein BDA99DRAFT_572461 [Phascolomyces articulosus]|uniref:Heterokaryon incompatibility domain-containing protein n=1 Tax=Phascolomyces articulosus TaxID=60185 RepID=A0AAD5JZ75_9FUNG|nr:hypothetical protein BDA99DRAFT_572461 [Phascolomyces articulosus]